MNRPCKPKAFLIGGLPASGKSTFAQIGSDLLNAEIISLDDIYTHMLKKEFMWRNDLRIIDAANAAAQQMIRKGKNVILDSVYMDEESRKHTVEALKSEADIYMIFIDVPLEICKSRNAARKVPVEDWAYEKILCSSKAPSADEGFITVYRYNESAESIGNRAEKIQKFFKYISADTAI